MVWARGFHVVGQVLKSDRPIYRRFQHGDFFCANFYKIENFANLFTVLLKVIFRNYEKI